MIQRIINALAALLIASLCLPNLAAAITEEDWCLARGFDPSNLSCDTCALLEESTTLRDLQEKKNAKNKGGDDGETIDIVAECMECCQSSKVNPILRPDQSLKGKYRYALLAYDEGSIEHYGEIKDFLERDMGDVLKSKGEKRFRAIKTQNDSGGSDMESMMGMMMMGGGGMFGGGPPKLMFFERSKNKSEGGGGSGTRWTEEDEEEADMMITLRGWKREDVKDMLLTLLPNA